MMYYTDFTILPDSSLRIRFSLNKCIVKCHELQTLTCKDMKRTFTQKEAQMVNKHGEMCSMLVRSKMSNVSVMMVWVML